MADDNNLNKKPGNSQVPNARVKSLAGKVGSAYLQSQGVPKGLADKAVEGALNKKSHAPIGIGKMGGTLGMMSGKSKGKANVDAEVPLEEQSTFGGSVDFFEKILDFFKDPMTLLPTLFIVFIIILIMGIVIFIISIKGEAIGNSAGYSSIVGGSYCTNITITGTGVTYPLEEYVARVVKPEIGGDASGEGLKAQAILARTYILNETSDGMCEIVNSKNKQAVNMDATIEEKYMNIAKETEGLVLTYNGKITQAYFANYPDGIAGKHNWNSTPGCGDVVCDENGICTTILYRYPSKTAWDFTMPASFNGRTYNLMNENGHCHGASQLGIAYYESLGENYQQIIAHFFDDDVEISKLYTDHQSAIILTGEGNFDGNLIYYDQTKYTNYPFCGRKIYYKNLGYCNNQQNSICTSGCGATSMAIILASLLQDLTITPPVISDKFAVSNGVACSENSNGTLGGAYGYIANIYNINMKEIKRSNITCIESALARGDVLIKIGVGPGLFTGRGHIMTIVGYQNNQFYILDPNGGEQAKSFGGSYGTRKKNGYWNANVIVGQMNSNFLLFSKNSLDNISGCQ